MTEVVTRLDRPERLLSEVKTQRQPHLVHYPADAAQLVTAKVAELADFVDEVSTRQTGGAEHAIWGRSEAGANQSDRDHTPT